MEEKVYFENSKGDKLCGILANPLGDKSKPIIIIVHGFSSHKNKPKFISLASILANSNISSFRFDIWGHGESEGIFEDITITEAVDDILKSIKFLKSQGYQKIGLVGSSFGGLSSMIVSSKEQDLYVLALISPVSDYEEVEEGLRTKEELKSWMENGYMDFYDGGKTVRLKYSFFEDCKKNIAYNLVSKISVPTMIVHGDNDKTVPINQSIKTSKLIPNCKLIIVKGAGHNYSKSEEAKMLKIISNFIIERSMF